MSFDCISILVKVSATERALSQRFIKAHSFFLSIDTESIKFRSSSQVYIALPN